MVSISILYQGQLCCLASHDSSGSQLPTDAPKDNFGKGENFSPTDLVAAALGSCMITTIGIFALKEQMSVVLEGTRVAVEKHMSTAGPRRIAMLVARLDFPPGIPEPLRLRLKEIADNCPVAKSLHPDLRLDVSCQYPD